MEQSILLLKKIVVLLIMILMGYISVRRGKLRSEDSKVLSSLCFDWVIPCSLFGAFQTEYDPEKSTAFLVAAGAALFSVFLFILVTRAVQKPLKLNKAEQGSVIFTNSAGVAAPLCVALFGSESLFYCAPHLLLQNVVICIYLPYIMSRDEKTNPLKLVLNRNTLAVFLGLAVYFTGIRLPSILTDSVKTVGNTLSPVTMFMIGMLMGGVDLKAILRNRRTYLVLAGRLLVLPALFILCIRLSGLCQTLSYGRDMFRCVLVQSAAPCAALVTQMSARYLPAEEAQEAGSLNIATSLLSVITMPLILYLFELTV